MTRPITFSVRSHDGRSIISHGDQETVVTTSLQAKQVVWQLEACCALSGFDAIQLIHAIDRHSWPGGKT